MSDIGVIVLAAGASSRMGTPKQLLPYQGQTLIEHILNMTVASIGQPVIVVLGANADQIKPKLIGMEIRMVDNPNWRSGMSTSIRVGLEALKAEAPNLTGVLFTVCDQPLISTSFINRLVHHFQSSDHLIVASEYAGVLGVPALFDRTLIPELLTLKQDVGAKSLIQRYRQETLGVPNPQGQWDIDTPTDYKQLLAIASFPTGEF